MIVITGLIVGIFVYIITIQKLGLYGIMRAQGIQIKPLYGLYSVKSSS